MLNRTYLILLSALIIPLESCTEAELYDSLDTPYQANKLTVSGTVCTDDPHERNFPVKILFIMDTSKAIQAEANDNHGWRGKAISEILDIWGKSPNYSFGIITYGAQARNLIDDGFTKDSSVLSAATASVSGSGGITSPVLRRDLRSALSQASNVLTGDILSSDPGLVARTTYVLVLLASGPPVPAVGRCECRDKATEDYVTMEDADGNTIQHEMWAGCPWSECEGCKVTCPEHCACDSAISDQDCFVQPSACGGCSRNEFCDSDFLCKEKSDEYAGAPICTVGVIQKPPNTPDTFTQWVPPATPGITLPAGANTCSLSCVYENGMGHPGSCEERVLVNMVREMKTFAKINGAAQFQLHTTYLPDKMVRNPDDPFAPPCSAEADQARATRLLSEMAFAAGGGFTQFGAAMAISFRKLDLHTSRDPLVIKELVVSNENVIADASGTYVDTDADGLHDEKEKILGTCLSDEDTDGDGLGDLVEIKLAHDPFVPNEPVECIDLDFTSEIGTDPCAPPGSPDKTWKRYADRDGDKLNACEERLLGLQDTLFDSDADGIPDKVEFTAGTNYLAMDQLEDMDLDGVVNREEIRGHTDARSNDAQSQLDLAYRYEEVDEGIRDVRSITPPPTITGITIKNVSATSDTGIGWLQYKPGPPPTLSWRDPADMGAGGNFGEPVDISRPTADGHRLGSCLTDIGAGGCTPESQERFITVMVEGPAAYPDQEITDQIAISSAPRNCLRFRVRNITLMETAVHRRLGTTGNNTVNVFFAEAPRGAKDSYGVFRVRSIQLNYKKGPPEERTPKTAEITVADDDFSIFEN